MMSPESPREVLNAIIQWAKVKEAIRAVLLTSTRAVPNAHVDVLSDYDVILIVQDIQPLVSDKTWLSDFGDVLVVYWDAVYPDPVFGLECCGNVTQYADGLKIDFTLWSVELFQKIVAAPALPDELDAGYQVLLDKDSLTETMQLPTFKAYIPKPPTLEQYQTHVNDFLTDAPYVAKCLRRGELMPLKWALDYDMKHVYLRQVLEWYVGVKYNWSVPVGSLGKGLKKVLPSDMWARLEQTYAAADLADNWRALAKTLELFRQVSTEVGEHLGYVYPNDLHQRVVAYVEQIKQLEPHTKLA
jgi:aminoglycoside 6-adenylyltransferase